MSRRPVSPGEIIRDELKNGMFDSYDATAVKLGLTLKEFDALLDGEYYISTELAYKLHMCFGPSPEFWLNIQNDYQYWLSK